MKTVLQLALDLLNEHRALKIAKDSVKGGVDWLEVGTPLIKSEGMDVVRKVKETFPDKTIVADMKVMDTGAFETEMASKAGADIVCILGVADDSTIIESVKSARNYGSKIMVDLIGVKDKVKRAKELGKMGIDYICMHIGIDEQMIGKNPVEILKEIVNEANVPVAVAGGINSETAVDVVNAGASIVIVGGAITKAKDATEATKKIRQAITDKKKIKTDQFKKYSSEDLIGAFSKVSTPNISDAMHRAVCMQDIHPVKSGYRMVGRAVTVRTIDGDWAKPVEAVDKAKKGDILIIDACKGRIAVWGELATWSAMKKGLAGVVVDGAVRDVDDIVNINVPVFSRHISSNAGDPKGYGEIGSEVVCGGIKVKSGDYIVGDDSGVVVIPSEIAQEIANRALDIKEHEDRIRQEIKDGSSLGKVLKLKKWEKK